MPFENQISITDKIVAATNELPEKPAEEIREQLISLINDLIITDFHALVQLLYSVDVDEEKLKQLLKAHPGIDSASIIAGLIMERQLQKIATKSNAGKKVINPDESW